MAKRRIARERALQALYQLDVQGGVPSGKEALESAWVSGDESGKELASEEMRQFALEIVEGVRAKLAELDGLIETHSHNWRVERMARIDRNVLRLGAYELLYRPDVPKKVTLNEAVELGKKYGNEESSAFINGLLDKLAKGVDKP